MMMLISGLVGRKDVVTGTVIAEAEDRADGGEEGEAETGVAVEVGAEAGRETEGIGAEIEEGGMRMMIRLLLRPLLITLLLDLIGCR